MNLVSRTLAGGAMIIIGVLLIAIPLLINHLGLLAFWIYGIPVLVIGIFLFFNKKEDKIEQIKSRGGKK